MTIDPSALAGSIGPSFNGAITQKYAKNQIGRKYTEAIEAGISEDRLLQDIKWMLEESRSQGDVAAMLRVYRFIMEYTVGKPTPTDSTGGLTHLTIIEAMQRGAEYMVQLQPPGRDDEDSQPRVVPDSDGAPRGEPDGDAAGDS